MRLIAILAVLLGLFHTSCSFRMMTFNVWSSGQRVRDGIAKVANQIKRVNPDVVAIQEMFDRNSFRTLIDTLGPEWSGMLSCIHGDTAIVDSYDMPACGMNIHIYIQHNGQLVSVWSMHLQYQSYGPYASAEGKSLEDILRGEYLKKAPGNSTYDSRVQNIRRLMANVHFVHQMRNSDNIPVIVAGDFNTPSHRDWTEATKNSHNGSVVEWPATKILESDAGMVDSFREVHPDPVEEPGLSWTVYREDGGKVRAKDRIDFIFYRGNLRPTASSTFNGNAPIIDDGGNTWTTNEWPSDHWAVYTDFENAPTKNEKGESFAIDSDHWATEPATTKKCAIIY